MTETFNGQNPTSTTVSGSRAIGGTILPCASLAGWPTTTAVHFATYRKDSTGAKIAGSQTDWKGVVSGSSVNTLTRQGGAADGGNGVGDIVEMMPTYSWANDLAKGLENTLNQDGTLKSGLTIATPTLTTPTLTNPTSTNPTLNSPTFGGTPATGTLSAIALTNPYKFSVYLSGTQTVSANTWVQALPDTKAFDTGNNYSTSTHQFTAPINGFYCFMGTVVANGIADTGSFAMGINVGTFSVTPTYVLSQLSAGANTATLTASGFVTVSLTAGQTVQLDGYSGSTAFVGGAGQTTFSGFLLSPT